MIDPLGGEADMDVLAANARIDNHLAAMDSSDPATPETANAQLAATLAYVGSINEALALSIRHVAPDPGQVENFTMPGGAIVDDIVDKLQKWIEQLLAKLTQIVKALGP